ncbi:MAG: DUF2076 domain-containing protein [Salinisphaera sp.]|jgi:hypothetical protein|nr:DUF2076 domain-containing protein [Salinisphaera sp.]
MQDQEKQLIDGLFDRLRQAERQTAPRDAAAETRIQEQLREHPNAPYYMAQALLIQEAALNKLHGQVTDLEQRLADSEQRSSAQPAAGGFLSSLFGGGTRPSGAVPASSASAPPPPPYAAPAARGTGFLGGAVQTAVGVAGGVVMAEMLTNMFHHSQPEEIVNVLGDPSGAAPMDAGFDSGGDRSFLADDSSNNDWGQNDNSGYDDPGNNGFDDGGWGDDDNLL